MPKAKCPTCATVVTYAAGYDPICPKCGFRGAAPAAPQPPAAWTPVDAGPHAAQQQADASSRRQGMAVAALVCGIAGFLVPPAALAAIILGAIGISQADRDPQRYGGKGLAVAGLVLGLLFFLFWFADGFGPGHMGDGDWMWDW